MGERKSLSKRTRFEIFKRDGFRCHYCGATPVQKVLRVDHVVPVAEGGEDDPANLITACFDCNAGKAAVPLDKQKFKTEFATEAHREHAEQIREWLAIQRDVHAAKEEALDQVVAEWERRVGSAPRSLRSRLWKMLEEFGLPRLVEAFEIVASKDIRRAEDQIKYLHGILRRWREGPKPEVAAPTLPPVARSEHPYLERTQQAVAKAAEEISSNPERFPTEADRLRYLVEIFSFSAGESMARAAEKGQQAAEKRFWRATSRGLRLPLSGTEPEIYPIENYEPTWDAWREISKVVGEAKAAMEKAVASGEPFDATSELKRIIECSEEIDGWLLDFLEARDRTAGK